MKLNTNLIIKTLFLFVIVFALAFSVSASLSISATQSVLGTDGKIADGSQAGGSFSVSNTETAALGVGFSYGEGFALADSTKAKITGVTFSKDSTTLAANDGSETITFTVSVPIEAYAGLYTGTIKAESTNSDIDPALKAFKEFSFTVPERLDVASGTGIILNRMLVGRTSSGTFTITNEGNKEVTITNGDIVAPSQLTLSGSTTTLNTNGMTFVVSKTTLDHQGSITVTATMSTPVGQTPGTYTGGNILVDFGGASEKSIPLTVVVAEPKKELTVTSAIKFGGSGQARKVYDEKTFTISNSGDEKIEGITVKASSVETDYLMKFKKSQDTDYAETISAFSLNAGASQVINVKVYIPEDQNSGIKDIGDILVESTDIDVSSKTISKVELETRLMLEIVGTITAEYDSPDDDSQEDTFGNSGTVNGVLPGSDITFSFDVKNKFSDSNDAEEEMEIRSIRAKITLKGIDDGSDESKSTSVGTLDPQEEESVELKFSLPREINEKTGGYKILVELYGTDKKGARHEINWEATLDIEKHDDFIEITKANFRNPIVYQGETAKLEFEIQNMGQEKEDAAEVQIKCDELGIVMDYTEDIIDEKLSNNVLSDKSKWDEVFEFEVKDTYKPGVYKFEIESYYDNDVPSDNVIVELTIKEKETTSTTSTDSIDNTDLQDQALTDALNDVISNQATGQSTQANVVIDDDKFTDSTAYYVLLIVGLLLLLAILVLLVVKVFI